MSNHIKLVINNNINELDIINDATSEFLNEKSFNAKAVYIINLALEEFITNIIKYSYTDNNMHKIIIELIYEDNNSIIIRLEDDGLPFDPLSVPAPDINKPLEERSAGGLGIYLVRKMANEIQYHRNNNINITEIKIINNPNNNGSNNNYNYAYR